MSCGKDENVLEVPYLNIFICQVPVIDLLIVPGAFSILLTEQSVSRATVIMDKKTIDKSPFFIFSFIIKISIKDQVSVKYIQQIYDYYFSRASFFEEI